MFLMISRAGDDCLYTVKALLYSALLLLFQLGTAVAKAEPLPQTLVFGVVPQQAASTLAKVWGPLLAEVSQNAKLDLRFATAPDIPTFEARLAKGEYDIAYMNPHHYVQFNQAQGYQALVKETDKMLKGIIVVPITTSDKDLEALKGQTLAFPAPGAFAASMIPRANLKQRNIDFTPVYVGSHDSVYMAVSNGLFAAGGGVGRTFNNLPAAVKSKLRILWTTPAYTPHAIAVHPRVSASTRVALQGELVALFDSEQGQQLLSNLGFNALEPANDNDWDNVRTLNLGAKSIRLQEAR
ncbi:PhnD/SsuA/transferrin family substrate-binding protein [Shewanella youngdeokensis]|uniref:PhnD/SsuA/transferrin family substrate-binding protein n=1 Tax=Shewanella youngdeokensis TaxID=2999068 RepID=A0ABZ0K1C5_9GAMM|nr:PhnD/SsuA/transferrin family substrate-binding protein [Shewanella sp. DAU334]